ncbi:hypothetical protein ABZ570_03370 [Micromonospora sp. NPDC007271]|uniref:hypothetical protein n=1 Tax=Micromonospora sp. NPDC007271 TaxID=3154587 RepID=UPI0033E1CD89
MPFVEKRLRWFDDGAPLLRATADPARVRQRPARRRRLVRLPPVPGRLLPSRCHRRGPHRGADPPRALGGRSLLLTCAACNNTAGTALDAHAVRRQHLEDFFIHRQATGRTLPVTVHAAGIPLRGTIQ